MPSATTLLTVICAAITLFSAAPVRAQPASAATRVVLTQQEQDWMQAHPVLTMALDQNNPPMIFRRADADGASFAGACFEYAELVARYTGLQFRYQGSSWNEALAKGMAHEADGVLCARDRPERRGSLNFSAPYLELPIAMATRADHADLRSLGNLGGERVAVVRGTVRVPVIRARCPSCQVIEVDNPQQGMERLQQGQADGYFDDLPVIQRMLGAAATPLKIALLYYDSEAAAIRLALRNDAPELLSIVDKGVAAIPAAEHDRIRARWLASAEGASVQRELTLTPAQRAWLTAHPVIRVGVDSGRAPIESQGEDGKPRGISIEFLHRLEEMLGVRFTLVQSKNVAELLGQIERREVDLLSAITQTSDRQRFMLVSDPYLSTPVVLYTLVGTSSSGGLGGLNGKRVAVSARSSVIEAMQHDWPAIQTVSTSDFREGTELLRQGRVSALIGPLLTGTHQLVEHGSNDVRVSGETEYSYRVGMGLRSDWTELLPILNQALAAIPKSERDGFRQKWSVVRYDHETDYRPLYALGLAMLFALLFILQLRRMVKHRTAELRDEVQMRRAREEEIQQLNAALERRVQQRTAELEQANEDLRLAADQLVQTEKVASLGRLVAGIAHELNTPLGSTLTAATTLKAHLAAFRHGLTAGTLKRSSADDFIGQCQQACDIIERNAYRAAGLIDNFKELAVDQASVRRRKFPLLRTVEEVLATHHNAWKATPHKITLQIDPAIELDSFPGPLAQVLSNLLENTLVHGFRSNQPGQVRIAAQCRDERLELIYSDDGSGIPAEFRNKVYDPFFTTRLGQGGSGLGLYIVQTLVTGVLGGTITLHSNPGQGTLFQLNLPISAPDLSDHTAPAAQGLVALPDPGAPPAARCAPEQDRPAAAA
ncbi:transporter substrate-binding domain-containing protein [Duganella sp. S19_KUP01_CR8]|uniref:transporter substrate-binding domain-containing protein n=1 Tax=Duganella sp. S19_KUP01_CR8 TaxID=3025502 RepID=UPI002FCD9C10